MTLSEDIAGLLVAKGLGVLGTNIGPEYPALPDDYLTVRPYPGEPPEHAKSGGVVRRPRFQVSCRSESSRAASLRAEDAYKHLSGFQGVLGSPGTSYIIRALGEPVPIGRDANDRERVVCNFESIKQ